MRVALILEKHFEYHRGIMRGVAAFSENRRWDLHFIGTDSGSPAEIWENSDGPTQGVIGRIIDDDFCQMLMASGMKVVNVAGEILPNPAPTVTVDNLAIGQMAAEHLLQQHFKSFAFMGIAESCFSDLRLEGFRSYLQDHGHQDVFVCRLPDKAATSTIWLELDTWLRTLPNGTGIFACNDYRAKDVIRVAHLLHRKIPQELGLLGSGNDLESALATPRLSSIQTPGETVGYEAAKMLDHLLQNKETMELPAVMLIPPVGVMARETTNRHGLQTESSDDANNALAGIPM